MALGTAKSFNNGVGVGIITADEGGLDVFVRTSDININPNTLTPGQRVLFEITNGANGLKASNVQNTPG